MPRFSGVDQARAVYEEEVANYHEAVLIAFKEVEDHLASLRIIDEQNKEQDAAVNSANRTAKLARLRYQEGANDYLHVIDAERSVLLQKRVSLQLDGERARSTVNLIRALGGSWDKTANLIGKL